MADGFEELGISPALVAGVESLEWDAPTGLQRDALPVIRRGNNVVLYGSAGAGVVGAWGLGVLDQLPAAELDEGDDEAGDAGETANAAEPGEREGAPAAGAPPVLVLVPDDDSASRTADSLARLGAPAGLTARAYDAGWAHRRVNVLVVTPTAAAAAVRDSVLKLEGVVGLVVDGLDQIQAMGQWDELETMVDIVPGSAQRVVVTGRLDPRIEDFIERHVRKAMTIPARSTVEDSAGEGGAAVQYRIVPERDKAAAVVSLLRGAGGVELAVVCRSRSRARSLESDLGVRGIGTDGGGAGPRIVVLPAVEADRRSTKATVISADVPFDTAELAALHARGGTVLATPRERAHLLRIARRAGVTLEALADARPSAVSAAESVRDRIRAVLAEADLGADLALVEPLLDAYPAAEVAAAALHLARSAPRERPGAGASGPSEAAAKRAAGSPAAGKRPGAGAPPPPTATTWTHLFVTVGSRDDVSPGDIVGAMTGEAGITGEQVGKIDIRESHTTVEVATPVADQVISALNGRTLKGRSLRVDYDRKARAPRKPAGGRGGGPGGAGRPRGGSSTRGGGRSGAGGGRPPRRG